MVRSSVLLSLLFVLTPLCTAQTFSGKKEVRLKSSLDGPNTGVAAEDHAPAIAGAELRAAADEVAPKVDPPPFDPDKILADAVQETLRDNQWKAPAAESPKQDDARSDPDRFNWKGAMSQSILFLGIQHTFRLTQHRTQRELGGPFFKDWVRSVKHLRGWDDGDSTLINYVAHPLQGGLTGRIFVNNSPRAQRAKFGSSEYWESRLKALVWSAAWSTQFELGPISEASIGNVGLRPVNGTTGMGYVDLVMTPTAGTGVVILEDAVDHYVLKNWIERKFGSRSILAKVFRSLLTPTTSFANILRGQFPWKRNDR